MMPMWYQTLHKKATIHQVTTMLATPKNYKNFLFPDHNHLLTTDTDDLALWLLPDYCNYPL